LAAFLTLQESNGRYIKSMEEAAGQRLRVCTADSSAAADWVLTSYPNAVVESLSDFYTDPQAAYNGANCDAIVISMHIMKRTPLVREFICERNLFAVQRLTSFPIAWPATPELARSLSFLIQASAESGHVYRQFDELYQAQNCHEVETLKDTVAIRQESAVQPTVLFSGQALAPSASTPPTPPPSAVDRLGRRLRGGGSGSRGAAAGGGLGAGGDDGQALKYLSFTEVGQITRSDVDPLTSYNFISIWFVLFAFVAVAIVFSLFEKDSTRKAAEKAAEAARRSVSRRGRAGLARASTACLQSPLSPAPSERGTSPTEVVAATKARRHVPTDADQHSADSVSLEDEAPPRAAYSNHSHPQTAVEAVERKQMAYDVAGDEQAMVLACAHPNKQGQEDLYEIDTYLRTSTVHLAGSQSPCVSPAYQTGASDSLNVAAGPRYALTRPVKAPPRRTEAPPALPANGADRSAHKHAPDNKSSCGSGGRSRRHCSRRHSHRPAEAISSSKMSISKLYYDLDDLV
jgi:hypothetical protein